MATGPDQDMPVQDGYYAPGQLLVTVTSDEHGSQVKEYKDKLGRVVLKRSMLSAHEQLDTYYIYDIYSNLRVVIQPEGMRRFDQLYASDREKFLDNWAFRYRYDGRKRMVEKKVPGAGWVHMVYDGRDRMVLSQDANQREEGRWLFTKYDHFNRPVISGWYERSLSRAQLQEMVNEQVGQEGGFAWYESAGDGLFGYDNRSFPRVSDARNILAVTYYDRYAFIEGWGEPYQYKTPPGGYPGEKLDIVRGQVTGTMTRILESDAWIRGVSWYDDKYRVVQSVSGNHLGGTDRSFTRYDFVGKLMATRVVHSVSGQPAHMIEEQFEYDHAGRVLHHRHSLGQAAGWGTRRGVEVLNENGLKKTGPAGQGDAGAVSGEIIPALHNGWIEAQVGVEAGAFAIGMVEAADSMDMDLPKFLYALIADENGLLTIREKGSELPTGKSVASSDVMKVARSGGRIMYYLNDSLLYTSLDHSAEDLNGMVTIHTPGLTVENIFISGTGDVLLAENAYNEIGELIDKKLHSLDGGMTARQSLDYRYNIRGWLQGVNEQEEAEYSPVEGGSENPDYFSFGLYYDQLPESGQALSASYRPQFNGNISAMAWKVNLGLDEVSDRAYTYTYDPINRITSARGWTKNEERWMKNDFMIPVMGLLM